MDTKVKLNNKNKRKPKPRHWLFTLYWWNPMIYIGIMVYFFICLWDGGIKEWCHGLKIMIYHNHTINNYK